MKIIVRGNVVAQGRPRFFRRGGFVGTYDDSKSKTWKDDIRMQAISQNIQMAEGPLFVRVDFHVMKPKSVSKKRLYPVVKPDLSNYLKGVEDALNGLAWKDDAQIVQMMLTKNYTHDDPRVEIIVLPVLPMDEFNQQIPLPLLNQEQEESTTLDAETRKWLDKAL